MTSESPAPIDTVAHPTNRMHRYAGYAFDLDGTVYLGDELLPGAAETIAELRAGGAKVVFATNNPLRRAEDYAAKLRALGIEARSADVITSLDVLAAYLGRHHSGAALLLVSEPLVKDVLVGHGFTVVTEPERADVVVVSFDRTFDYAKLHAAFRAVRAGAVIVATNPDAFCPTADGGLPDCAAMLAAVEASTGQRVEAVAGKPSGQMAQALLDRLGVPAADAVIVGDRLMTDVAMARRTGMVGVLVLTGATTRADLRDASIVPDAVIDRLTDLL